MKYHLDWVFSDFTFTDSQRNEFLRVLPKDKDAAQQFVNAAQIHVRNFLSAVPLYPTSEKQHKEKLERLAKTAMAMRAALDDIPADTGASLQAEISATLLCDPYKYHHMRIGKQLAKLGLSSPCRNDFLEGLLDVVAESATRLAGKHKVRTKVKPENKAMIGLTAHLVRDYADYFQKEPSASNGGNFRKFMNELSKITGYEFGAETVKEAIRLVAQCRTEWNSLPENT